MMVRSGAALMRGGGRNNGGQSGGGRNCKESLQDEEDRGRATWVSSYECIWRNNYEGLVPRCDERLKDPSHRVMVGHVEERIHLGWGEWVQYLAFALLVVVWVSTRDPKKNPESGQNDHRECEWRKDLRPVVYWSFLHEGLSFWVALGEPDILCSE
jgi:hypothetical protein